MTDPKPSTEPTDSDFVDRVFDYLRAEFPSLSARRLARARDALRAEFAGGRAYVASRTPTERQALVQEVLSKFNGRNATEVARRLGIGRATVYRHLKQARFSDSVARRPDRLKFGGIDTDNPLGSAPATALATPPEPAETQEPTAWPSPPPT